MMCAAFVAPNSGIIVGGLALADENPSRSTDGRRRAPFLSSSLAASSSASSAAEFSTKESAHRYDGYDRPIVLLGLSSSPRNNELQRLALSLSGALVGNNPKRLQSTLEILERSQGAGLLGEEDDEGIDGSASASGGGGNERPAVAGTPSRHLASTRRGRSCWTPP